MRTKRKWGAGMAVLLASLIIMANACDGKVKTSPSSAFCTYVLGDGSSGHDAKIHQIVYPDQKFRYNQDTENVRYVPCNSRNYKIDRGDTTNANGEKVGDRHTVTTAYTKDTHTAILIWSTSNWTLNEDKTALALFWKQCQKYTCASDKSEGGTANFSTPGWNGLLGEVFGSAVDSAALTASANISDDIWKTHDPRLYDSLGKQMSEAFADKVRGATGYSTDLFCGSGNSRFQDDVHHQGWICTNVRVVIDRVEVASSSLFNENQQQTLNAQKQQNKKADLERQRELNALQEKVNADALAAAKAKYGSLAEYFLGLQDTLAACKAPATCVVSIGGGTAPVVVPGR